MSVAEEIPVLTFEEYLAGEERSQARHEYVNGRVYLMAGGTERHALAAGAIYAAIRPNALKQGCRPFFGNRLVRLGSVAYYPDVFVTCSPSSEIKHEHDLRLVVEVQSPSTTDLDRREKSVAYAGAPSFEQYLLVHPDVRRIEVATPDPEGLRWQVHIAGSVVFTPFGEIDVDALYDELDATSVT